MKLTIMGLPESNPYSAMNGESFTVKRVEKGGTAKLKNGLRVSSNGYQLNFKLIDWEEIPEQYRFAAMDSDGEWWAYTKEPVRASLTWRPKVIGPADVRNLGHISKKKHLKYWRYSLQRRPVLERPVNKFRIEAVGDAVVFQVLEMDERFRCKHAETRIYEGSEMKVASAVVPEVLDVELVYLRGVNNHADDRASFFRCLDKISAIRLAEKLVRSLIEWAEMYEGFRCYTGKLEVIHDIEGGATILTLK